MIVLSACALAVVLVFAVAVWRYERATYAANRSRAEHAAALREYMAVVEERRRDRPRDRPRPRVLDGGRS